MKTLLFHIIEYTSVLLLITVSTVISQSNFDYSDVNATGASCYPKDSCIRRNALTFTKRSCECDSKCHQFKDCCIDVRTPAPRYRINRNVECIGVGFNWGVYAVSQCPTYYKDDAAIKSKCEDENDIAFPLAAVPATDAVSSITYKNRYCAHCNNAQAENLRSWDINIECDLIPNNSSIDASYVESHLKYVRVDEENFWGFYYPENSSNQRDKPRFYPCRLSFTIPRILKRHMRLCRPNLVSTCAEDWTSSLERRKCEAYMAVIYISPKLYRNPHCALCNNINIAERKCNIPTVSGRERKPALSFKALLAFSMKKGNDIDPSSNNSCRNNEQWDPRANRCRKVRVGCSIPGFKKQNGVCVPP